MLSGFLIWVKIQRFHLITWIALRPWLELSCLNLAVLPIPKRSQRNNGQSFIWEGSLAVKSSSRESEQNSMVMETLRLLKIANNRNASQGWDTIFTRGLVSEWCPWLGLSLFEDLRQASAWICLCSTYVFIFEV